MQRYSKDPSILRIKQYFKNPTEFSFVAVDKDIIAKEIKNLVMIYFLSICLRFLMKVLKRLVSQTS